ncbi:MAG: BrnA antitoxin family protein [Bryobacterales bacterium]|nr:BrnA antitoxin family protein [Bryobacterales bacterium]
MHSWFVSNGVRRRIRLFPSDAVIGKFYRPNKQSATLRLDADVLAWLRASGEGYQTRVNAYLRQLMTRRAS